jgi:uncharacterized membrane protein
MRRNFNFMPISFPLFVTLLFLLFLLLPLLIFLYTGGIVAAFSRLGFSPGVGFLLFILILVGSTINIPVKEVKTKIPFVQNRMVNFFGVSYRIPVVVSENIVVTMNVGGALLPVLISVYELSRMFLSGYFFQILITIIAVTIVSLFCYIFARPVKGVGIAVPFFIPPLITVLTVFLLARGNAASVAYISGTLGTLIGADILNLNKVDGLGAPIVSIGGAGTFDGIFITGILSVLLI